MVKVETPAGVVHRHLDQVRHRHEGTPGRKANATTASEWTDRRTGTSTPTSTGATSVAPQAHHNGAEDEVSAADQPPTGHIDDSARPAQQVPHVDATAESTEEAQPLLRRSTRIRKPVLRF
ncbi:hypothetical protein MTO96_048136 [Rhipicephalus appendiculatus]